MHEYTDGRSVMDLCEEYQIPKSTIYHWIHQFSEIKTTNDTITSRQVYLLQKRIKALEIENEIWRKSQCAINSPLDQKLAAIEQLYEEYGVHACCRVLEVLRSTFYHYLLRRPEVTLLEQEDAALKPVIHEVFMQAKGRIGAKKIRAIMMTRGYKISDKRIAQLMRGMDLVCVSQKKHITYIFSQKGQYYTNKLKRQFTQDKPNAVWVSDITRLYINYKPYYLCVFIDLFSRRILSYSLDDNQETPMVINAFLSAYESRCYPKELMIHSDQGSQYTSFAFKSQLRKRGIKQSFSNPGSPYDNAVAESFFRTLKAEKTSCKHYHTIEELNASIEEYIHFFNEERPQQKLNYQTPKTIE